MRKLRLRFRRGELTQEQYEAPIHRETEQAIRWQENLGLDVLVHGEFERNDMVEYFGELLDGFAFTAHRVVHAGESQSARGEPARAFSGKLVPTPLA